MGVSYKCNYCIYKTDHKAKYTRHRKTLKCLIARHGIECCGLRYFEKYQWVNHKKSCKHAMALTNPVFPEEETPVPPEQRMALNLTLKTKGKSSKKTTSKPSTDSEKPVLKLNAVKVN